MCKTSAFGSSCEMPCDGTNLTDCARTSTQICYSEIAELLANGSSPTGVMYDQKSASAWADYVHPVTKKRSQVWFDTPGTLAIKMAELREAGVRGVSFWQSGCLNATAPDGQWDAMWDAITAFRGPSE